MKITILKEEYEVLDTKEKITIADSFIVRQNKIGTGKGEAKLYVGQDNRVIRDFFGKESFNIKCFLLKKDLLHYLEETKVEYLNPEQPYINKSIFPNLWQERLEKITQLSELIEFEIKEQSQISGPRIYVKSTDRAYKIIRELSLPNITYITIVKLVNQKGELFYYFKLFADYFGNIEHPYTIEQEEKEIAKLEKNEDGLTLTKARKGQGKYRQGLLNLCPYCPITMVSDDRLLIASHIKPWAKSNDIEKIDPMNGFMFTPTFDYLFDRGFMTFTEDKRTKLSPFLSKMTYSKLGISDNKIINQLVLEGREKYMEYHRKEIFQGSN
ncbi:MAG: putative type II restriction endonuclease [uncultured Sulfurovum sp.]|uniref:Putative type II restriction endonuclease n=1 Tax=uncultured Sulfurovum sp. TaxID=269237 RepID=A0A6S6TX58_9BACT|nr:MAG: putative type II restriction endonuclease [uncultured Sulfurovum sp.]